MLFGYSHLSVTLYRGRVCAKSHLTATRQAPLSMGFLGKNTGSGLPCPPQGIFPTQGSNPCSLCLLHWQVGSLMDNIRDQLVFLFDQGVQYISYFNHIVWVTQIVILEQRSI